MTEALEWAHMTGPELRELAGRGGAMAILPLGATEQHGPHLSVSTDTESAYAISICAARLVSPALPVVVLPRLWLGMSENMNPFGGAISVDFATLRGIIASIARSLQAAGFVRLLIVNGHGGNMNPLAVIVRELALDLAFPIGAATPWLLAADKLSEVFETAPMVTHACEGEASLMLAIDPDLVRVNKFGEAVQLHRDHGVRLPRGFARALSYVEQAPLSGTEGDPRAATIEKGRRFLAIQAEAVAALIRDESHWSLPDPVWAPGRGLGPTDGPLT